MNLAIYVIGRAAPCAYGSSFTLEKAASLSSQSRPWIEFAASIVGRPTTREIELPVEIAEPTEGCGLSRRTDAR